MIVTYWMDGNFVYEFDVPVPVVMPPLGTRVLLSGMGPLVVSEHWYAGFETERPGWHVVIRRPDTPAESTPPWKRKEEG